FVTSERHEKALLGGTERLIGSLIGEHPDVLEKVVKILQLYYNHDLLSEDVAVKWGSKASKKYVDLATSKKAPSTSEAEGGEICDASAVAEIICEAARRKDGLAAWDIGEGSVFEGEVFESVLVETGQRV
ncbi:hypothetical protein BN1708_016545, partial [Verticillium longisporum]